MEPRRSVRAEAKAVEITAKAQADEAEAPVKTKQKPATAKQKADAPPDGWEFPKEGDTVEVEVESGSGGTTWERATVISVLVDGAFQARIKTKVKSCVEMCAMPQPCVQDSLLCAARPCGGGPPAQPPLVRTAPTTLAGTGSPHSGAPQSRPAAPMECRPYQERRLYSPWCLRGGCAAAIRAAYYSPPLTHPTFAAPPPHQDDSWEDWFTWREEGTDWRRADAKAAGSSRRRSEGRSEQKVGKLRLRVDHARRSPTATAPSPRPCARTLQALSTSLQPCAPSPPPDMYRREASIRPNLTARQRANPGRPSRGQKPLRLDLAEEGALPLLFHPRP